MKNNFVNRVFILLITFDYLIYTHDIKPNNIQDKNKVWKSIDPFDNINEKIKTNETIENKYVNDKIFKEKDENCNGTLKKLDLENKSLRSALLREKNMKQMFFSALVKKLNINLNEKRHLFNYIYKDCKINFSSDILDRILIHINKEYTLYDEPEVYENILKDLFLDSIMCNDSKSYFDDTNTMIYIYFTVGVILLSIIYVKKDNFIFSFVWRCILVMTFIFSVCAEYYRQYQAIIAKKMAAMNLNDNLEDACRSKGTFFESFFNYFQIFQLTKSKSECLMRHEDMLISPFSEINILSVIVKVLTSAIFTPLSVFGQQSNEFYNEYFRDTTLPLFLVKFTILILVIMLGFFYLSNFQISTWFWTFGPSKVPREIQGPKEKIKEIFIKEKEPLKALGSSQGDKNKSKSPVLKKRKLSLT